MAPVPAEDVLVVAKPDDPVGLDPADVTDLESAQVCVNIYDTLVRFKPGSLDIEGGLAVEWSHSEDGKTWTFKLRPSVKFHDGTPCDAEAVVANFERQLKADHPLRFDGNKFIYAAAIFGSPSKLIEVRAKDPGTVEFVLSEPMAPFLQNLALPFFGIVSPKALAEHKLDFARHPVGTGPFRFKEWKPRERLILEANPDYWGGAPSLKQVTFRPVEETTSRQLQVQKGAAHLVTDLAPANVEALKKSDSVTVESVTGLSLGFVALNVEKKPFDDVRVRQAVSLAIDEAALVKGLYRGQAVVADQALPPQVWGRLEAESSTYDPEKARSLLAEAGFPDGFDTELRYMSAPRSYFPEPKSTAEALGSMLRQVGIRCELSAVEWGVYLEEVGKGAHQMALAGWIGDHGDPDNYLHILFSSENLDRENGGTNLFMFSDPKVDALLKDAQTTMDREQRRRLYVEAGTLVRQARPWVPLVFAEQTVAHHPKLSGFQLHPTGLLDLQPVHWSR